MIRRATLLDIPFIADIDRHSFSGNKPNGVAEKWIATNFARGDQYQYFVFEKDQKIVGFIGWEIKNGFAREVPVFELEKLAVSSDFRGQGIATSLMSQTFLTIKDWVHEYSPEATEFKIFAWALKNNEKAIQMYKKLFNDEIQGERSIFSIDEILLRGSYTI